MKKIKAIKLGLILLIGASMALLLHCNALATANKNELSKTEWEKLTKDLHYNDDVKKANESALQQKTPHSKSFSMPTFNLSRTAQIVLILLVAIFIFIMAKKFVFRKNSNQKVENLEIDIAHAEEKLLTTNLEQLLQNALQQHDWRIALRIYYLIGLQKMHQHQLINWQKEKTNRHYFLELINWELLPEWKKITQQYELTWYGEMAISEPKFAEQEVLLKKIIAQLQTNA